MKLNLDKSVTLVELLIAMSLLGLLVIGISSIETFSRYQLTSAGIRSRLQNEVSFLLEHMAKEMNKAIGGVNDTIVTIDDSGRRIRVYIDNVTYDPGKGKRDSSDYEIAYQFNITPYAIRYYPNFTGSTSNETIARNITVFNTTYSSSNNYVAVIATGCANPPCGSINNPNVTMTSRIEMPSVSTN